jgi:hypothetical protein
LQFADLRRTGDAITDVDALPQRSKCLTRDWPPVGLDLGDIFLFDTKLWVCQSKRELTIVREEQEPLGLCIESTHGINPWLSRYEINHGFTIVGVLRRRDDASRFVQQVIDKVWANSDRRPIHFDDVTFDIDTTAENCRFAIDANAP